MEVTVTIDDDLYQSALEIADPNINKADIFQEAIKVFIRIQNAKRIAALGGTMSKVGFARRRIFPKTR